MCKIGVVLVTYNRIDKLRVALQHIHEQNVVLEYILIVNNYSNDGTKELLEEWKNQDKVKEKRMVFHLKANIGGSGGFAYGMKKALELDADWIWISDDDAYPERSCLAKLYKYIQRYDTQNISALCSSVIDHGNIDTWHRRKLIKKGLVYTEKRISQEEYKDNFEIDFLSYVGSLINKKKLQKVGVGRKDFFIAYDDSEHSIRLRKKGKIICIPEAKVFHDTNQEGEISWKKYYSLRNKIYTYKIHYGVLQALIQGVYFLWKYHRNKITYRMAKKAFWDAMNSTLGKDNYYKPGRNVMGEK